MANTLKSYQNPFVRHFVTALRNRTGPETKDLWDAACGGADRPLALLPDEPDHNHDYPYS